MALLYRGPQREGRDEFSSFVPVGFFSVLKSLLAAGYRARLHNLSALPARRLPAAVAAIDARAVLISAFYGCHHEAFRLATLVKRQHPSVPVILGGPLAVLAPAILSRHPQVDFVVQGEGERAAPALLDALLRHRGQPHEVAGVWCTRHGRVHGSKPEVLADIDEAFFLPSEVLPHCHGVTPENLAVLITSRGCPYRCAFCSSSALWPRRIRYHRIPLLREYLWDLRRSTGALYCSIRDENFLANRDHVREFTAMLRETGLHYLWNCQGSVRFLDDEVAAMLAAAGCDQVQMGIETVTPRLQTLLAKPVDPQAVRAATATLKRHAIRPFGYFIYGMGESEAEVQENLAFLTSGAVMDAVAGPLVYYPGTTLGREITPARFLDHGEVFLVDPETARRYRPRYRAALARLARNARFTSTELAADTPVALIARYHHLLGQGRARQAHHLLTALARRQPTNPWPWHLLAAYHEERGETRRAAAMRRRLADCHRRPSGT